MSALPLRTDLVQHDRDVRFVPEADIRELFDHIIGGNLQCLRHRNAECFWGLEVDNQLKSSWPLNRQVCRAGSTKNLTYQSSLVPIETGKAHSVGHQLTNLGELAHTVNHR